MSDCGTDARPGDLPTLMRSADAGASSSRLATDSRSNTTTSARPSTSAPFTVNSPGSPGPAPTRYTSRLGLEQGGDAIPDGYRRRRIAIDGGHADDHAGEPVGGGEGEIAAVGPVGRLHQAPWAWASTSTASLTAASFVAATTTRCPALSPGRNGRFRSGATIVTAAPAARNAAALRVPDGPRAHDEARHTVEVERDGQAGHQCE
jgi:hypothetical protein